MKKILDKINLHDIEAVAIMALWFVWVFAVGLGTAALGNLYWAIYSRVGAPSVAVEWVAHGAALSTSIFILWAILCRCQGEQRWPWN